MVAHNPMREAKLAGGANEKPSQCCELLNVRCEVTKDELIVKQQLEIESLKVKIAERKESCRSALQNLIFAEQWSPKCESFPRVAMKAIVRARQEIEDI